MPKNKNECKQSKKDKQKRFTFLKNHLHFLMILVCMHFLVCFTNSQLPQKIFNIEKTLEEVPIIKLSDLSQDLDPIRLIMDTGSSELAIFDDQCDQCQNTFSACPHIKNINTQTFISYLLSQFRGDFSYLTLGNSLRIRFFCVLKIQGSQSGLQTNGVLGIRIRKTSLIEKTIKQSNGIRVWKQIMETIYKNDIKALKQVSNANGENNSSKLRLKYSILYTEYHTKLILGEIPETYFKNCLGELSLSLQVFTNSIAFFSDLNENNLMQFEQTLVHFDSGSSVIVLPWSHFESLLKQLNLKNKNHCQIQNNQIKCSKHSLKGLIESDFKFQISIYQRNDKEKLSKTILSISLQNLIEKTHKKSDQSWFILKIISHKSSNENEKDFIILGVPLFKQYLVQYDIPFESEEKGLILDLVDGLKSSEEYKLKIYDHQLKQSSDLMSPYVHLMKKYDKNIKMFTFFYLFFVFLISYLFINLYWWVHSFLKGKRQLV